MSAPLNNVLEHARALALVLGIDPATFAGREQQATLIMAHLASMPVIADHGRRRAYGNEILQNANRLLPFDDPANHAFADKIQSLVAQMQTLPAWWHKLSDSNTELASAYKRVGWIIWTLRSAGMGGAGNVIGSGVRTGVKEVQAHANRQGSSNVRSGLRGYATAAGSGASTGAQNSFTGGFSGRTQIVWVIGSLTYVAVTARQKELADEVTRRFQEGKLSAADYRACFGQSSALPQLVSTR